MKTLRWTIAVVWRTLLVPCIYSQSPTGPSCLVTASQKIEPGKRITVIDRNDQSVMGKLIAISMANASLALGVWETTGVTQRIFAGDQIRMIKYRKPGKLRMLFPVIGFLAGSVVGQLAENYIIDPGYGYGLFDKRYTHRGSFWGGLSGAFVGTGLSLIIPSTRVLRCP
jgi:hypothetical protein